jgi:pyrroloquinoline quinone (PQQ) biosynthesis protein C
MVERKAFDEWMGALIDGNYREFMERKEAEIKDLREALEEIQTLALVRDCHKVAREALDLKKIDNLGKKT